MSQTTYSKATALLSKAKRAYRIYLDLHEKSKVKNQIIPEKQALEWLKANKELIEVLSRILIPPVKSKNINEQLHRAKDNFYIKWRSLESKSAKMHNSLKEAINREDYGESYRLSLLLVSAKAGELAYKAVYDEILSIATSTTSVVKTSENHNIENNQENSSSLIFNNKIIPLFK